MAALDNTGTSIDAVQRDYRGLDEKIEDIRSGQRVMAWSGTVAAVVLMTLSVAGYFFTDIKQRVEREDMAGRLGQIERRVAGLTGPYGQVMPPDPGPEVEGRGNAWRIWIKG